MGVILQGLGSSASLLLNGLSPTSMSAGTGMGVVLQGLGASGALLLGGFGSTSIPDDHIKAISDALGECDAAFLATCDLSNSSSGLSWMLAARQAAASIGGDSAVDLALDLRGNERSTPSRIETIASQAVVALENHVRRTTGMRIRERYRAGVDWSEPFRALYRRAYSAELPVRVGTLARASGAWTYVPDKAFEAASSLEIRAKAQIGAAAVQVTATVSQPNLAPATFDATVAAASAKDTVVPLGSYQSVAVSAAAATGGSDGDTIEIWIR